MKAMGFKLFPGMICRLAAILLSFVTLTIRLLAGPVAFSSITYV